MYTFQCKDAVGRGHLLIFLDEVGSEVLLRIPVSVREHLYLVQVSVLILVLIVLILNNAPGCDMVPYGTVPYCTVYLSRELLIQNKTKHSNYTIPVFGTV